MVMGDAAWAVRIAVLSDIHVTPGNECELMLGEAVGEINAGDTEIVLMQGDLTNEGSDLELLNVKAILDRVTKPLYVIPGNHENNWSQSAGKTFVDLWGSDRFAVATDSLAIIGINSGPYMKMGDAHIKQEDLAWLDTELALLTSTGKRVLSVCHYPLGADIDNYIDYLRVLEKYPVVTQIGGHYHTFKHYAAGGIDGLICRALDMKDGNYGYSILEIDADSVRLYDKQLGVEPQLVYAYRANTVIEPAAPPADTIKPLPDNVTVTLVHRDEASVFTRVSLDGENVYFGNSLGEARAVSRATGEVLWSCKTGASLYSRPAVAGDEVIVPTADRRLLWIDKRTGEITHSEEAQGAYVADGVVAGGILYQGGYKSFAAWDVAQRKLLWECDSIGNYCQAAPAIDSGCVVFGAWDTRLRCLDRATGQLRWQWSNGNDARLLSPGNCVPVLAHGKAIIVAPDRYMTAIDMATGRQLWRDNSVRYRESLGISADGNTVYAKTMDGEIVAVDAMGDYFTMLWRVDAGLGYDHAPCIVAEAGGIVFAGSRRGILVAVDPVEHRLLWQCRLGTSELNGIEVDPATGDIYTSLIEGTIWKIAVSR